jgi:hypothetical protein
MRRDLILQNNEALKNCTVRVVPAVRVRAR